MIARAPRARVRFLLATAGDPLAADGPNVIANLSATPKKIDAVYVYDKAGTALFERQCGTPEYYLRRVETDLLREHGLAILDLCGFPPLVELGAGTAEKSRLLFAHYERRGLRCDYFPIDVDGDTLGHAAWALTAAFPSLFVHGLAATYVDGLRALPAGLHPRLVLFLGSSLGNMEMAEMTALLARLHAHGAPGDWLLLGADLDKPAGVIDAAYNDAAGYGPRSTLNMLPHLNRRYGGDFDLEGFRYRSRYDAPSRKNVVRLESLRDQCVTLSALNFTVSFAAAEMIDAEVMWKFDPDQLTALLQQAGFAPVQHWIEPVYRYGLFLLRRC